MHSASGCPGPGGRGTLRDRSIVQHEMFAVFYVQAVSIVQLVSLTAIIYTSYIYLMRATRELTDDLSAWLQAVDLLAVRVHETRVATSARRLWLLHHKGGFENVYSNAR